MAVASIVLFTGIGALIAQSGDDGPFLPNLIGNPSFESSTAGWAPSGGATFERVKGGFDGAFSLEVRGPASLAPFGLHDGAPWVTSTGPLGTQFRASAWVRSTAHGGRTVMRIREIVDGNEVGASRNVSIDLTTDWQLLVCDYVTHTANSQLELDIVNRPRVRSEVFRTDNVIILAIPPPEILKDWRERPPRPHASSGDLS